MNFVSWTSTWHLVLSLSNYLLFSTIVSIVSRREVYDIIQYIFVNPFEYFPLTVKVKVSVSFYDFPVWCVFNINRWESDGIEQS